MNEDERLKNCFINGLAMGMGITTLCFVFMALLFPFLFILQ